MSESEFSKELLNLSDSESEPVRSGAMPTPLSTRVCSSYTCYVVALIACTRSTFGKGCILSSFFSGFHSSLTSSHCSKGNSLRRGDVYR
jgi:hypothetical protein